MVPIKPNFYRLKYFLFLGILFSIHQGHSQVRLAELLKKSSETKKDLYIENQTVLFDADDATDRELLKDLPRDTAERIIIPFNVTFDNCTFPNNLFLEDFNLEKSLKFYECTLEGSFGMWRSKVDSLISWNNAYSEIYLEELTSNTLILMDDVVKNWMEFIEITIGKELEIDAKATTFGLASSSFTTPNPTVTLKHDQLFHEITPTLIADVSIEAEEVSLFENEFVSESDFDLLVFELKNASDVVIARNRFGGTLSLKGECDFIKLFQNTFNKIEYNDFSFPEFESSVAWEDIAGDKIIGMFDTGIPENWVPNSDSAAYYQQMNFRDWEEAWVPTFYFGKTDKELRFKWFYDELFADYYRMYLLFKAKGKIEDANSLYVEMKDLYGRRLGLIYKDNPTLKNYLNWKLNRLLKLYTEHGTDPAKSIVISIYILIIFSGFYFLFPSEWDDFEFRREKWKQNGKLKNIKTILIHFGNSITLSLNSFVTLGFGRIPTTGFARYICIIEGFIGWFLLSIFTVSLINQLLF